VPKSFSTEPSERAEVDMKVTDAKEIRQVESGKPAEPRTPTAPAGARAAREKVTTEAAAAVEVAVSTARSTATANRALRLEAIEAAIRQGTFRPDPQRIAERILEDAELTAALQALLRR
jgi:negative regulator of flagellin synthesis FlgM